MSEQELINIIDEIASSAASLNQSPQNYDSFIKARESCIVKLHEYFEREKEMSGIIEKLYKLL